MATVERELSREMRRIVACQYPPALLKLADLLAHADGVVVQTCMHNHPPGVVVKLASVVSAALPLWSYTLDIVKALSHSPPFRHQLLLQNPSLLCTLLTKATASQQDFDKYVELGVLLLSHPLPEAVPLPACTQSFFLRVFDKAVQAPHVTTLQPIYCMLNGAGKALLGLLPSDARHRFDKELCHILSSNSTGKDSMLLLWCFGIVVIAEHAHHVGTVRSLQSSSETTRTPDLALAGQWNTTSGRKLFGSTNGLYKTINLTYLSVIWAAKGDVVADTEAVEGIRIATRILTFVHHETRKAWPSSSPLATNIFPKLPAKILRKGINMEVQFQALCFYAMIVGENNLQSNVVEQYEVVLANMATLRTDNEALQETLSLSLPIFAPQLRESAVVAILSDILHLCTRPVLSRISNLTMLVNELTAVIPTCAPLRSKILIALSSNGLQERIQNFLYSPEMYAQEHVDRCDVAAATLSHKTLVLATISMLLTSALTACSIEPSLPHPLAIALVSKQQHLVQITTSHSPLPTPSAYQPVSLFEQKCTPSTARHSEDWRDRLKSELESQSFYQRDSVIRSVAQICSELESRCETVEKPLRIEQSRSKALEAQVARYHEQVLALESEALDRRLYVDGLEAELNSAENEKSNVGSRLDDLQAQFSMANQEADEALRAAREEFITREMQFRSTILTLEEDVDALSREKTQLTNEVQRRESEKTSLRELHDEEVDTLNREKMRLSDEVERTEKQFMSLGELHERVKADSSDLEQSLKAERRIISQRTDEINRLTGQGTEIKNRLCNTEAELQAVHGQLNELQFRHQELLRTSEEALQDLKATYENDIEIAANKANEEYKHLSDDLHDAIHDAKQATDAYEDTRRERELLQTEVNSLEAKVQQLNSACSEKNEELSELRAERSRVLVSMGLTADSPLPIRTEAHCKDIASNPRTSREHRRRKSAIQTQDVVPEATLGIQDRVHTAMERVADAPLNSSDSSRDGSTPKRAKPRSTFKIPTMHVPSSQHSGYPSRSLTKKLSPTKRSALRQLSPNRQYTAIGFAISNKDEKYEYVGKDELDMDERRGSLKGIGGTMQASFDMDGFLAASTPFTPGNNNKFASETGRDLEEEESITQL